MKGIGILCGASVLSLYWHHTATIKFISLANRSFYMNSKVKVLFVVSEFLQAGSQRFTHEMDLVINKDLFEINILCQLPLGHNPDWEDYYFNKHVELGTKIFFLNDIAKPYSPTLVQRLKKKILNTPYPGEHVALNSFMDSYDVILFIGEYNYPNLARKMTPALKAKSLILLTNSIFQRPLNYAGFEFDQVHHFISGFEEGAVKVELAQFAEYKHTYLPLSVNLDDHGRLWSYHHTDTPKIGIFTRLTYSKPLDPFIYSFHVLLQHIPHAELHIFGAGDPQVEGVSKYIRHLGLQDKVKFRGHQKDLKKTAISENLSVVWFHGFHGVPGGFAGFDISSLGVPQLFWDFSNNPADHLKEFPMFNNINALAEKTVEILNDEKEAEKLSQAQYQYIQEVRNIKKWIGNLENLFLTYRSGA